MIGKLLGALALALIPLSPATPATYSSNEGIVQVVCGKRAGTAFRISPTRLVTAAHVAANPGCRIKGKAFKIVEMDGDKDYAILELFGTERPLKIDCNPFYAGEMVFGIGYAHAWPMRRIVVARALGYGVNINDGLEAFSVIKGEQFIGGQSGGVVQTASGKVKGIVNARSTIYGDISYSQALRNTVLCDG